MTNSSGENRSGYSTRTLVLAVVAALGILLVVAFLPEVVRGLGLAPEPAPGPAVAPAPLPPVPAPGPAGPVIPEPLPAAATEVGPMRVEVLDADDRAPIGGAAVEMRVFGPQATGADAPELVDPATVAPHLRTITELRNQAALERSRPLLYHRAVQSAPDGVAMFAGVPAGQAEVVATEREDRVAVYAVERPQIAPPDQRRAPIVLLLRRATGRITGRVIDDTGAPKPGAEVLVVRNRPPVITSRAYAWAKRNPYYRAEAGPDGSFELPDLPLFDKYIVHAKLRGWGSASSSYVAVERAAASDVTLVLRRNRIIRGTVRSLLQPDADLTGARLVGYRIQDPQWRPGDSLRVSLEAGFAVQPDAQGRYELEAANTMRYVLIEATLPGHAPVRVVVDFGEGAKLAAREQAIAFTAAGRVIAGEVVDGAGRPVRARVTFVRESDNFPVAAARTDAEGRFHADWLADAVYSVLAEPEGEGDSKPPPALAGQIRPDRTDLRLTCGP